MTGQSKPLAFAGIAERLGKLIPRLASDHDGEVVATVAAIGRTLRGAGLDWHDLARRAPAPSFDDAKATAGRPPPDAAGDTAPGCKPTAQPAAWTAEREAEFRAARKPKKEPPPWPTWGTLSHFGRLAMLDVIVTEAAFTPAEAEMMTAFHAAYYRHQVMPGPKLIRLFNAACRKLWERGWRPEGKAA